MELRRLGTLDVRVSELGVVVPRGLGAAGPGESTSRDSGILRRAARLGVTLFDASGSGGRAKQEALAHALSGVASEATILVGPESGGTPDSATPSRTDLSGSLEGAEARVGRLGRILVVFGPSDVEWLNREQTPSEARRLAESGRIAGWGVRLGRGVQVSVLPRILSAGARFVVVPGNLLDHEQLDQVAEPVGAAGGGVIVADPHAAGALDGSFLRASPLGRGEGERLEDWDRLVRRLSPVTRLGFLTEGRRRTLPQAALQYVLRRPVVASALIGTSDPRTLDESAALAAAPALNATELHELERLGLSSPSLS